MLFKVSYCAFLPKGRIKCCIPSVRPSVPRIRFSRNMKAVQTYNLVKTKRRARVTGGANLSYKGQRSRSLRHCERKCKKKSRISSLNVDRFRSNQDQNDHRPILQILSITLYIFCDNLQSVIIRDGSMSQRPLGRASTC